VLGGILSGILAFVFTSIIGLTRSSAEAVLNPSHVSNQILINNGCTLIPTTDQLLQHATTYWLLLTAAWIPKFGGKAVVGFLVGAGHLAPMLFGTIVQAVLPITIWFTFKDTMAPLSALGMAYGMQDWILGIVYFLYFLCATKLRIEYQLRCLCCQLCKSSARSTAKYANNYVAVDQDMEGATKNEDCHKEDEEDDKVVNTILIKNVFADVIVGGVQLMIVDLAVQLSITITIYLASMQSMATGYKLAAAQAAYWSFGPSYLVGINMLLKLIGSRLMGSGQIKKYLLHFLYGAILTVAMAVGAILLGSVMGNSFAYDFGESACIFASGGLECAEVYGEIFLGKDSLNILMTNYLGPTVGMQLIFMLLRAGLATCHDFSYMAKASSVCFVIGYVPSIMYAHYFGRTASSYFIAMYVPHVLMVILFGKRMYNHGQCILNGRPGPWSEHVDTLVRNRTKSAVGASDGLLANKM
jgi:hypothetical protein